MLEKEKFVKKRVEVKLSTEEYEALKNANTASMQDSCVNLR